MDNKKICSIPLDTFPTKDIRDGHVNGKLTLIWRDWDKILNYVPKMIYITAVKKNEIKGPHLHTRRTSHFVCISGKVIFIIRDHDGKFHELESSESEPKLIQIPKNIASAHVNISNGESKILALADIAWKPNDNEMENLNFDNYDWEKWLK